MATIYIDNKPYEVKDGNNLLHACLSLGFNVPYFCWHPAMHSVGACRQCAVKQFKDEKDTRGRIVMSCMTPASDGTRISIDDPEVKAFRASIIEWFMTNHPHDCPVCDEGGECHLQDMTQMTGHVYRRFRFKKRTYNNQYLGPFLTHEMNRCIQCYRCVRFYRDYAGGRDFDVFASHNHVYFGRHEDGVLQNEFSGNLVEVCPTGVFDDKTFNKHYTRKWDLQTAPSICVHCGVGCNTIPGERYGRLRRIRNRYNGEVNRYFLCDRGRYGYEFVNSDRRIRRPLLRPTPHDGDSSGGESTVAGEEALRHIADLLYFGAGVIGIGSPRASLEANFALRSLVGPEHFYSGTSDTDSRLVAMIIDILSKGPARSPSLLEV
ncbi:MAG: NADH-quinone oxidoreductase subunit NuoG, partial [Nitrospirae bacterium]|nr:NADH-quinone oxidoreductase subunit NuoG [Nitrospirota bacterium]